ncbi:MAG TPA: hypothetical protein VGI40_20525 [Pirellulaceae bacterium]|jgi:uncharacterized membrane-anchored protein YhcB (DUF1043 family)
MRFTIRDLLWLTAVVALAVGWSIEHFRLRSRLIGWHVHTAADAYRQNEKLQDEIDRLKAELTKYKQEREAAETSN